MPFYQEIPDEKAKVKQAIFACAFNNRLRKGEILWSMEAKVGSHATTIG